jgi:tetratricopeptide (TPR) repeat protein
MKVDHKVIVEWVVLGQTVGFIGSVIGARCALRPRGRAQRPETHSRAGGLNARARKQEVESLNKRLMAVNKQLREQAREQSRQASASTANGGSAGGSEFATEVISLLRAGKALLKQRDGAAARDKFSLALSLARGGASAADSPLNSMEGPLSGELAEPWKAQRKALRGLGAACTLMGDNDAALAHMQDVLALSEVMGDAPAIADALGVIADLYTDKGDLDKAGEMYDRYLAQLSAER